MNHSLLSSAAPPAIPKWRRWLRQPVTRGTWQRWRRILTGVYILASIAALHDYIPLLSPVTVVGILALLHTPSGENLPPQRFRFAWPALLFMTLYFFMPERTLLYGALCCAACLLLETFYRRLVATVPIILGLLSPVSAFFIDDASFPIRRWLTAVAAGLLGFAGLPVSVAGIEITVHNHPFFVDHAVEGLHMLLLSLLAGLLLINYYQSHYRRRLRLIPIGLLLVMAAAFNVITNLFRIIALVIFRIVPANPLHHLLGLVFLLAFMFLPLMGLTRWTTRRWGIPLAKAKSRRWGVLPEEEKSRPARSRIGLMANIATASAILFLIGGLLARTSAG